MPWYSGYINKKLMFYNYIKKFDPINSEVISIINCTYIHCWFIKGLINYEEGAKWCFLRIDDQRYVSKEITNDFQEQAFPFLIHDLKKKVFDIN